MSKNNIPEILSGRTWTSIRLKANKINLVHGWTEKEVNFLISNYMYLSKIELEKHLNKTWSGIRSKAMELGLKRSQCKNKIRNLLNESCEAYYWMGFLMADGYFRFESYQIHLNLSNKDFNHIKKYINFIEFDHGSIVDRNNDGILSKHVGCGDKYSFLNIVDKFGIKKSKTYNGFNVDKILNLKDDFFLSFLIGFIDGDGNLSVKKNGCKEIRIRCHKNWTYILLKIHDKMYSICNLNLRKKNKPREVSNCAYLSFSRKEIIDLLMNTINTNLKEIVLLRKWERFNDKTL